MVTTSLNGRRRRSQPRSRASAIPSMSGRQLDAYLLARDTLRRVGALASMIPEIARDSSPPASQA